MNIPTSAFAEAAHAAVQAATENASKTGVKTSEFWVNVLAAAGAVLATALLPGIGGIAAAAALGVGAAAYSTSRGNVKAAALAAGQAAAQAALQAGMAANASSAATSARAEGSK